MRATDKRDLVRIESNASVGVTLSMLDAARHHFRDDGGELAVWAILREDVYESKFGDGFHLHLRGLALNRTDADRLAALGGAFEMTSWWVRPYRLALEDGAPSLMTQWREEDEFSINDFIEILAEIPLGATTSMLMTGSGAHQRQPGPHMLSLT